MRGAFALPRRGRDGIHVLRIAVRGKGMRFERSRALRTVVLFFVLLFLLLLWIVPELFGIAHLGAFPVALTGSERIALYSALVSGIGLVLVSISLRHAFSSNEEQRQGERHMRLLHMLEEWHSPAMNAARHRWFDEAKNARVHEHGFATSLVDTVFVLVNFFEKYGRLHLANALDDRLLKDVFGDYARWYEEHFFREIFAVEEFRSRMNAVNRREVITRFLAAIQR